MLIVALLENPLAESVKAFTQSTWTRCWLKITAFLTPKSGTTKMSSGSRSSPMLTASSSLDKRPQTHTRSCTWTCIAGRKPYLYGPYGYTTRMLFYCGLEEARGQSNDGVSPKPHQNPRAVTSFRSSMPTGSKVLDRGRHQHLAAMAGNRPWICAVGVPA